MLACAEPMERLLLTEKWMDSIPYLRIFCLQFLLHPFSMVNPLGWRATGRSDLCLKIEVIKRLVGLTVVLATMWISVEAIAYGALASMVLFTVITAYPNKKFIGYGWIEQMKDLLPVFGLAAAMGVPVYFMSFLPLPDVALLAVQVVTGGVIYVGLSALLKFEVFRYLWGTLKGMLKRG